MLSSAVVVHVVFSTSRHFMLLLHSAAFAVFTRALGMCRALVLFTLPQQGELRQLYLQS